MREIEFRGKRADNGEWVEGGIYVEYDCGGCPEGRPYILTETFGSLSYMSQKEVIPETVGQYTGLTDKNGEKIFEGDIIIETYARLSGKIETGIYAVEWKGCGFIQIRRFTNGETSSPLPRFGLHEVIGNIHDNPELLK